MMRRRLISWSVILAVASAALATMPGFDILSFHFCLPMSVILAMACGGVSVTALIGARAGGRTPFSGWVAGLEASGVLAAVPLAVITASAVLVGPCDYGYGLLFYLAGPVMSAACGWCLGSAAGSFIRRPGLAYAAFYALFAASFMANLVDLFRGPAVFFYNPFLGLYPGPIYDDLIEVSGAYAGYRAFCLAGVVALAGLTSVLVGPDFRPRIARRALAWVPAASALGVAVTLHGMSGLVGFRTTRADVEAALTGRMADRWCNVRYDASIDPRLAGMLLSDCGFRHRGMAAFFGVEPGEPVTVWLYRDPAQKAWLIGAREVEITKPWLSEVHVNACLPGDPVLGHEVAHVVAGRIADNPLHVPLRWGLVPDMARVEGIAVAAAFAADGPSPHEWALAMTRAGVPYDIEDLFGTWSFLSAHAGRAYTLAGSFVRFVSDVHGPGALRAIAAGEGFEEATGRDLPALAAEWQEHLVDVAGGSMDEDLLRRASGRFSGPGVLGRDCPVDTARVLHRAAAEVRSGDSEGARECLATAADLSPGDRWIARRIARLEGRDADPRAEADALALAGTDASPASPADLVAAADALAMLALAGGDTPGARVVEFLTSAGTVLRGGAEGRGIEARMAALPLPPPAARVVFDVLSGCVNGDAATSLAEVLALAPDSGLLHYLLGKALVGEARHSAAVDHMAAALALGLPDARFEAEAEQVLGIAACWAGMPGVARVHLSRALEMAPYEGDRMVIEEYLERLAGR